MSDGLDLTSERRLYEAGIRPSTEIALALLDRIKYLEGQTRQNYQDWQIAYGRAEAAEQAVERAYAVDALQRRDKGALYRRAEAAEAAVQRVREVLSEWDTDEDSKGLHFDVSRALDGGEQE